MKTVRRETIQGGEHDPKEACDKAREGDGGAVVGSGSAWRRGVGRCAGWIRDSSGLRGDHRTKTIRIWVRKVRYRRVRKGGVVRTEAVLIAVGIDREG